MEKIIDFHCHFEISQNNAEILKEKINKSNRVFVNCILEEKYYDLFKNINDDNFLNCMGKHPMFPDDSVNLDKTKECLINKELFGIGEIGLDKRNTDFNTQKKHFLEYLDLAHSHKKPVFIHCVAYYNELIKILKGNFIGLKVFLHSFNGSVEIIESLLRTDNMIYFSLNPKNFKGDKSVKSLRYIIKNCRFVFETDYFYSAENFDLSYLSDFIKEVSLICNCDYNALINEQWKVFKEISE